MSLNKNLAELYGRYYLSIPAHSSGENSKAVDQDKVGILNLELAAYGWTLGDGMDKALSGLNSQQFLAARENIHSLLDDISGASSNHNVLFAGFPYSTPDQWEYFTKRVVSLIGYMFDLDIEDPVVTKDGLIFSRSEGESAGLFDLSQFGVDPVTQFGVAGMRASENVKYSLQSKGNFKTLEVADEDWIVGKVSELLAKRSSLSQQERGFIELARGLGTPDAPETVYRETLPIAASFFERDWILPHLKSATDVLRLAVYWTDPSADLSLSKPVRFRLKGSQAKRCLELLDGISGLEEDMLRYRERWLRLGEQLKPAHPKNSSRFPRTANAFQAIRNEPKQIQSFNRMVEKGLSKGADIASQRQALSAIYRRPGEAMRRIDWILRSTGQVGVPAIEEAAKQVGVRSLFNTLSYLKKRKVDLEALKVGQTLPKRVFAIKSVKNKIKVIEDTRSVPSLGLVENTQQALENSLEGNLRNLPSLGRVWIDPELHHRVVAWNRRGDSASSTGQTKGSAYSMDDLNKFPVMRLFAWWKGNVDVDLSLNVYSSDWKPLESIGFYNLHNLERTFVHSGDIQNAPEGASEFIDIDLNKVKKQYGEDCYLVPSVISYRGDGFDSFPCYAGAMMRDALRSGKRYEPESVRVKFDITAATRSIVPFVWSMGENRLIHMDLSANVGIYNSARGNMQSFADLARSVVKMREDRLTMWDVAYAHATSRGVLVEDRSDAQTIFDLETSPSRFEEMVDGLDNSAEPRIEDGMKFGR